MTENNSIISIDEFDEPAQLTETFCAKLSEEEYERQTATETEKALEVGKSDVHSINSHLTLHSLFTFGFTVYISCLHNLGGLLHWRG